VKAVLKINKQAIDALSVVENPKVASQIVRIAKMSFHELQTL